MDLTGQQIGRFQIIDKLGKGAFGTVYRGRDTAINRFAAIKMMTEATASDKELVARFRREAEAAGRLNHLNVVTVYEVGEHEGHPYIAMEYLEGTDLEAILKERRELSIEAKVEIILQIAEGLHHAHTHGVIHRDVKPANIRLLQNNAVKIMDFGIAKLQSSDMTRAGQFIGTVNYMAPEQIQAQNRTLDGRTDLFAVGVIFYEVLTYRRPFQGDSMAAVAMKILSEEPPPMTELRDTPDAWLENVVLKCLEKDPDNRFESCEALADALRSKKKVSITASAREQALAELKTLLDEGEHAKILAKTRPLLEAAPEDETLSAYSQIARTLQGAEQLIRDGRLEQAQTELEEASRIDPENALFAERVRKTRELVTRREADSLIEQGRRYMEDKRFELAFKAGEEALRRDPFSDAAKTLVSEARYQHKKADAEELRDQAERMLESGIFDEAKRYAEEALETDPHSRDAKAILQRIEVEAVRSAQKPSGIPRGAILAAAAVAMAAVIGAVTYTFWPTPASRLIADGLKAQESGARTTAADLFLKAIDVRGKPAEQQQARELYASQARPLAEQGDLESARRVVDNAVGWGDISVVPVYWLIGDGFYGRSAYVEAHPAYKAYFEEGGYDRDSQYDQMRKYYEMGERVAASREETGDIATQLKSCDALLDLYYFVYREDPRIGALDKQIETQKWCHELRDQEDQVRSITSGLDRLLAEADELFEKGTLETLSQAEGKVIEVAQILERHRGGELAAHIDLEAYESGGGSRAQNIEFRKKQLLEATSLQERITSLTESATAFEGQGNLVAARAEWNTLAGLGDADDSTRQGALGNVERLDGMIRSIDSLKKRVSAELEQPQPSESSIRSLVSELRTLNPSDPDITHYEERLGRLQNIAEKTELFAARLSAARRAEAAGDRDRAEALYQEIATAVDAPSALRDRALSEHTRLGNERVKGVVEGLMAQARELREAGDHRAALTKLDQAEREGTRAYPGLRELRSDIEEDRRRTVASENAERIAQLRSSARSEEQAGRFDRAKDAWDGACKLGSSEACTRAPLVAGLIEAEALRRDGDCSGAARVLEKLRGKGLTEIDTAWSDALQCLGVRVTTLLGGDDLKQAEVQARERLSFGEDATVSNVLEEIRLVNASLPLRKDPRNAAEVQNRLKALEPRSPTGQRLKQWADDNVGVLAEIDAVAAFVPDRCEEALRRIDALPAWAKLDAKVKQARATCETGGPCTEARDAARRRNFRVAAPKLAECLESSAAPAWAQSYAECVFFNAALSLGKQRKCGDLRTYAELAARHAGNTELVDSTSQQQDCTQQAVQIVLGGLGFKSCPP